MVGDIFECFGKRIRAISFAVAIAISIAVADRSDVSGTCRFEFVKSGSAFTFYALAYTLDPSPALVWKGLATASWMGVLRLLNGRASVVTSGVRSAYLTQISSRYVEVLPRIAGRFH